MKLVFYVEFEDAVIAQEFERQIKKWTRAEKEALIRGEWENLNWRRKNLRNRSFNPALPSCKKLSIFEIWFQP